MLSPSDQVFVNCPFDKGYKPIFDAIVFAITDLGFIARSAREEDDGGEIRLTKIQRIIEECKYGVHDISAVKLDPKHKLPRFNMPLELGLFLGCQRYGDKSQRNKVSLIFDADPYRYQICISDIAGQDIHSHKNEVKKAYKSLELGLPRNQSARSYQAAKTSSTGINGLKQTSPHYVRRPSSNLPKSRSKNSAR